VRLDRWQALTPEQRRGFAPLCPDLVVELASPSDEGPRGLSALRSKMAAYQANGARLGWLLIPSQQSGVSEFVEDLASGATGSLVDCSASKGSLHSAYGMKHKVLTPTLNLDAFTDYCRDKKIFVKIDVEDAEDKVFAGGHAFFSDVMPIVLVECFDASRLALFRHLDYTICPLGENSNYLLIPPRSAIAGA